MAIFWAKNGSLWLWVQFWVPKISLLLISLGFIQPQEWKITVQNNKILLKKSGFFITIDAVYAHWCASDVHRCASATIGVWPTQIPSHNTHSHLLCRWSPQRCLAGAMILSLADFERPHLWRRAVPGDPLCASRVGSAKEQYLIICLYLTVQKSWRPNLHQFCPYPVVIDVATCLVAGG